MRFVFLLIALSCNTAPVPENVVTLASMDRSSVAPFEAKSSLSWVKELADKSNCVVKNEKFLKEIGYQKYTHTKMTGAEVEKAFRNMKPVKISTYRTRNPWSTAIATTYKSDKETVYLNLRKNPRPMVKMLNTAVHEGAGHLQGFSHGNNSPKGKEKSVPSLAGAIAEKYLVECK